MSNIQIQKETIEKHIVDGNVLYNTDFVKDRAWAAIKVLEQGVDLRLGSFDNILSVLHPDHKDNFFYSTLDGHVAFLALKFAETEYFAVNGEMTAIPTVDFMQQWVDSSVLKDGSFYLGGTSELAYAHTVFSNKENMAYANAAYKEGLDGELGVAILNLEKHGVPASNVMGRWTTDQMYNKDLWQAVKTNIDNMDSSFIPNSSGLEAMPETIPPFKGMPEYSQTPDSPESNPTLPNLEVGATQLEKDIAVLYVAAYNRAPDEEGLAYWVNAVLAREGDPDLAYTQVAEAIVSVDLFDQIYNTQEGNRKFVESAYRNVFNEKGDEEGISFWTDALDKGHSKGVFLASFVKAALGYEPDPSHPLHKEAMAHKAILENKVDVSLYYTKTLGEGSNVIDTSSLMTDVIYQNSIDVIANVTDDPSSIVSAVEMIDGLKAISMNNISLFSFDEASQGADWFFEVDSEEIQEQIPFYSSDDNQEIGLVGSGVLAVEEMIM